MAVQHYVDDPDPALPVFKVQLVAQKPHSLEAYVQAETQDDAEHKVQEALINAELTLYPDDMWDALNGEERYHTEEIRHEDYRRERDRTLPMVT